MLLTSSQMSIRLDYDEVTAVPPRDVAGALCDDVVANSLNFVVVIIVHIAVCDAVVHSLRSKTHLCIANKPIMRTMQQRRWAGKANKPIMLINSWAEKANKPIMRTMRQRRCQHPCQGLRLLVAATADVTNTSARG